MIEFKIKNCKVSVSFWFAVVLALFSIFDKQGIMFCSFFSAIFHELGHILCMIFLKINLKKVNFKAYAVDIILEDYKIERKKEFLISFAGVIFNLILFLFSFILLDIFNFEILKHFAICNLSLGFFNILPVRMLDGGNVIYLFLLSKFEGKTAEKILDVFSCVFLGALTFLCFIIFKNFKINFSLILVTLYLIINLFLKNFYNAKN